MKQWIPSVIVIGLLFATLALPFAVRSRDQFVPASTDLKLVIITPHSKQIRSEYERAFDKWHRERFDESVQIDWRVIGGSSDVKRLLFSEYSALAKLGRENDGVGYDLVFGGGDYLFDRQLKRGVSVDVSGKKRQVSVTEPIEFEPEFIAEVFPTAFIADKMLYDPDGHWWGAALSSFGIVYNRDLLKQLGLPEPTTWSDLTDAKYFNAIALADPSHSGSITVTYDAIIQRSGFVEGWSLLRRAAANARYFASNSSQVPIDVADGEAAAGMCIDFYGRYQSQAVGTDRVGYVSPRGMTVVTADPIAVLRGTKRKALAKRFIRFLLTIEGQALWNFQVGDPIGPVQTAVRRMPIRREMFTTYHDRLIDKVNPFDIAKALPPGTPSYFRVISTVLHSMAIDIHEPLKTAWQTINNESDPARRDRMIAVFDELPFTQDSIASYPSAWKADPDQKEHDRLQWTEFFLARYRRVVSME